MIVSAPRTTKKNVRRKLRVLRLAREEKEEKKNIYLYIYIYIEREIQN